MMLRGQEPVGQLPVIGDEEKSLGVPVQSSGGEEILPLPAVHEIQDGFLPFVLAGGDDAGGLVHHVIFEALIEDGISVKGNF